MGVHISNDETSRVSVNNEQEIDCFCEISGYSLEAGRNAKGVVSLLSRKS